MDFLLILLIIVITSVIVIFACKCKQNFEGFLLVNDSLTLNDKFIVFQLDCGGLNNIKMQLEMLTVLAKISGRTLVLFPSRPWYLLGSKSLEFGDVFDLSVLKKHIPVLTAVEFGSLKGIVFNSYNDFFKKIEKGSFGDIVAPEWSPGSLKKPFRENLMNNYNDIPIWYFYCNPVGERLSGSSNDLKHRMFSTVECYYREIEQFNSREFANEAIKFHPKYFEKARREMNKIGIKPGKYNAVHLRNWESGADGVSQFKIRGSHEIVKKLKEVTSGNTDLPILFLSKDVLKKSDKDIEGIERTIKPEHRDLEEHEKPIIDMIMASFAKNFIGSPSSTFSTGIMNMRKQLSNDYSFINKEPIFIVEDPSMFTCKDDSWNFQVVEKFIGL